MKRMNWHKEETLEIIWGPISELYCRPVLQKVSLQIVEGSLPQRVTSQVRKAEHVMQDGFRALTDQLSSSSK